MRQFVVMTATQDRPIDGSPFGKARELWAWCETGVGPGFETITYTEPNGVEFVTDLPDNEIPTLDRYLFTVTTQDGGVGDAG